MQYGDAIRGSAGQPDRQAHAGRIDNCMDTAISVNPLSALSYSWAVDPKTYRSESLQQQKT